MCKVHVFKLHQLSWSHTFDINVSDETRNRIGMTKLAEPIQCVDVFLVEPDKLDNQKTLA